jgi:hypothetical protein
MSVGLPPACRITASFAAGGKLRHEFYIDRATKDECKHTFDLILEQKDTFETAYGDGLSWERLDDRKASRIASYRDGSVDHAEQHEDYINWFVACGDRLRTALASVALD